MATFLLEVGTEELPAEFIDGAIAQWQQRIPKALEAAFLVPEQVQVYGTPRRLAVLITGLPDRQADRQEEIKGPPAKAAFQGGEPTKAALGFARKQGVAVADLEVRPTPKGDFVFVEKTIVGAATSDILTEMVPPWITGLEGKRFMRWASGDLRFPRPIRWLVALLDDQVLPLVLENGDLANGGTRVESDRYSAGHRVLHPQPVTIARAQDYCFALEAAFVLVDPAQRRQRIQTQTLELAQSLGGEATLPESLLQEVTNLVEWPTAVAGKFDPSFLDLPPEVITTVMIAHQRYFPIAIPQATSQAPTDVTNSAAISAHDQLLPHFVTIANGDPAKSEIIAAGNERVIQARLADGQFFYSADCENPLENFLPALAQVTFEESLGSVADKVTRIGHIADRLVAQLQLNDEQQAQVQRAAQLCKADLVSQVVYEFPELQGVMGQKYALVSGESEAVAAAIFEHYLPRGAGDALPQGLVSQVVGLADRLDTLVSIFGLGRLPSGSSDPFALRRAANAVVNIIWSAQLPLNLQQLLEQITTDFCAQFPGKATELSLLQGQLQDFFLQRVRTLLQEEQGIDYDLVNAVLGETDGQDLASGQRVLANVLDGNDRAQFLQTIRTNGQLDRIYETVNRSTRLAAQGDLATDILDPQGWVNPDSFQQPTETAFHQALMDMLPQTQAAQASRDYAALIQALETVAPTVAQFFDGDQSVLVMDPDLEIRRNRLNLLGLLRNHARVLGDFGAIVKGA
jgi:glycyl-tRNA synthetase beta chain